MEEEFYASVKLISGEELFGVINTVEKDGKYILICNPVIVTPMFSQKREMNGYKVEPWLKTSSDDMFLLCLLYTSPSPRDMRRSRMPSSA